MRLKLVAPPDTEPITLSEAKEHLRVIQDNEDSYIESLIAAAREYCEGFQNRAYYTQTWKIIIDEIILDEVIQIPKPPLQSLDDAIIIDEEDTEYDVTDYTLDDTSEHARLIIHDYPDMDANLRELAGLQIEFTAGHDSTDDISEKVKAAMKLLISHWYHNREAVNTTGSVPHHMKLAVDSLLSLDRVVPV